MQFDPTRQDNPDREPTDITWILISVIIISGLTLAMGSFFLISAPNDDQGYYFDVMHCDIRINADNDTVELTPLTGLVEWEEKQVLVNDSKLSTGTISSAAGEAEYFRSENVTFEKGIEYKIRIIDIDDNKVVYQEYVIAK